MHRKPMYKTERGVLVCISRKILSLPRQLLSSFQSCKRKIHMDMPSSAKYRKSPITRWHGQTACCIRYCIGWKAQDSSIRIGRDPSMAEEENITISLKLVSMNVKSLSHNGMLFIVPCTCCCMQRPTTNNHAHRMVPGGMHRVRS